MKRRHQWLLAFVGLYCLGLAAPGRLGGLFVGVALVVWFRWSGFDPFWLSHHPNERVTDPPITGRADG